MDISLKFGSMDKMKITYSDPKYYLEISVKGLITSLVINTIVRSKKKKNTRYAITNFSSRDISNNINEFEKFTYKGYVRNRPKHEPTDSYFYLSRHISKCMIRVDVFNSHIEPVRTKITGTQKIPISHVCDSNDSESKRIIVDENLLKVCSTDEKESESVIIDEGSMEKSESESVHNSINTNKEEDAIVVKEDDAHLVKGNPFTNDPTSLTYSSAVKIPEQA